MRRLRGAWMRVIGLFRSGRAERDLANELASHLQLHTDDNISAGMTPGEARRRALLALGGVEATKERYRDRRSFAAIENPFYDLRLAIRALARRRLLLAAAVTSIAIGVGVNVAVYTVLRQVLFSSQWIVASDSGRLVTIWPGLSYPNFQDIRRAEPDVDLTVFSMSQLIWRTPDLSTSVPAHVVSDNFFEVLGTRPLRGRIFGAGAGEPDDPHRVLLSFAFWQRLGASDALVGQPVTLNGWPFTIAGVLPREFHFAVGPMLSASVFVPISSAVATALDRREAGYFDVLGRLRPGVSLEQGLSSLRRAAESLESAFPEQNRDMARNLNMIGGAVSPIQLVMRELPQGRLVATLAATVYAMVGLVLLIACANVAGLLTARADERRHETAVRTALGATRGRLIQQFLAESLVIAILGCAVGGLLWTLCATLLPKLPVVVDTGLELVPGPIPFLYCAALSVIVAIACGLTPALASSQVAPVDGLKAGRLGHIVRGLRVQSLLVGGQVALSFVLLAAAFVLLHTFFLLRVVDPGYDTARTASVQIRPVTNARVSGADLKATIERLPGVESVSYGALPLGILPRSATVHTTTSPDGPGLDVELHPSGAGFLTTLGIPLARGRDLNQQDLDGPPGVVPGTVVNETFARRYLADGDPIGQEIVLDRNQETGRPDRRLRIVGVARNTKMRSLADEGVPVLYLAAPSLTVVVRVRDDAATRAQTIERAVSDRFPGSLVTVTAMSKAFATALLPSRVAAALLSALGAIGLTLAMIGLHGIVSYGVTRRSFEIGVRVALGATSASIVKLILRSATRVVIVGSVVGAFASVVVLQALRPLLASGQGIVDPLAIAGVAVVLVAAGAAASLRPARRAASVDPTVALRNE